MTLALICIAVVGLAACGVAIYDDPTERVAICVAALFLVLILLGVRELAFYYLDARPPGAGR